MISESAFAPTVVAQYKITGHMITPWRGRNITGIEYALSVIQNDPCVTKKSMAFMVIANTVSRECADIVRSFLENPDYDIEPFFREKLIGVANLYSFPLPVIFRKSFKRLPDW